MVQVVLASHNTHKLEEIRRMLSPLVEGIELVAYTGPEPVETGTTFEENALLKARAAAAHTGLPALADDSGIAVKILGGSPGIFSARWGGPARSDLANLELLLWQLNDVSDEHRDASFMCAASLAMPDGKTAVSLGEWRGRMLREPRGADGFGYDPIFLPDGETLSAAEMTPAQKDALSHRRRAFIALVPKMIGMLS